MKVLYITPYAPTPIRTRPYNLIRGLVRNGHTVTLATVWENQTEKQILSELAGEGIKVIEAHLSKSRILMNVVEGLISNKPLQSRYSYQPKLAKYIDTITNNHQMDCDIIHIEHLRGAIYGLGINKKRFLNPYIRPIVWDSVDNISALFEQAARYGNNGFGKFATRFELPRTRKFEKYLLTQFERILVTSPLDKQAFDRLSNSTLPGTKISIVTNGVDFRRFSPSGLPRIDNQIVFSGKMSYHANISAALFLAQEVMPIVWSRRPTASLILAGKDPPKTLLDLANSEPRISVTGTVPELGPYLSGASVCAAPLRYGAGVQNKVLEAMACSTPVVATPQAIAALRAEPGKDVLVADDSTGIANGILSLLENDDFRKEIGENGRKYVITHHDWDHVVRNLIEIYEDVNQVYRRYRSAREAVSPDAL